jgi:3-hydroxyisobutyrate dehydrogenase
MTDRIGFIGLGRLGSAIVRRLCEQGVRPVVWNRNSAKAAPFKGDNITVAKTPRDLASQADIVIACVHDAAAIEQILFGPDGVASGASAGSLFVDMSTIGPVPTRQLAARLRDSSGMAWVDAPVSGGVPGAQNGKLVVMAGGVAADIDRIRPVLKHVSQQVNRVGDIGTGQAVKAINQLIISGYVATIAEAMGLAARYDLPVAELPDILKGGLADSAVLQNQGRRMAAERLENAGSAAIMIKDLDIVGAMASNASQPLPVGTLVSQLYRMQASLGFDALGMIGLAQLYRKNSAD